MDFLKRNIDISNLSNYKTKSIAKYYFEINDINDLDKIKDIYSFSKVKSINILFIGGGTNLLFAFETYKGIIIKNNLQGWTYRDKILMSFSNEYISNIAKSLNDDYSQNIWKRFIGLPGSVGGAVSGNAGCFGLEIQNNFYKAKVFDLEKGVIKTFFKENMDFEYRNTIIKRMNKYFIIEVSFDLSKVEEKYSSKVDNMYFRENKQPKGNTCGSFFKNPSKDMPAGKLIEGVGLKGSMIGGAFFSKKHANFLMNDGTADYKELLAIITLAQKKVLKKYNIRLMPEVRIVYN